MRLPDKQGHFGQFGGRYVPETLMPALLELEKVYLHYKHDREFRQEFAYYLREYVGRPNPLYFAEKLTKKLGGARIYLKREDLNHTGAHKINNTIGQGLLARRMGKKRVIAGSATLKDAMNEAMRNWVTTINETFYVIGTVAGPHPYPMMVRDFQSIIGIETRAQMQEAEGRLPDSLIACIGGGSNAMGLFHPFLDDPGVEVFC